MATSVDDGRVRKALSLYKKHHPEYGNETPSINTVVDWLLKRGGLDHAVQVEERMSKIVNAISALGPIDPKKQYTFTGEWLIDLRVLAQGPITIEIEDSEEETNDLKE